MEPEFGNQGGDQFMFEHRITGHIWDYRVKEKTQ